MSLLRSSFGISVLVIGIHSAALADERTTLILSPTSLNFKTTAGGGAPPTQTLSVRASRRTRFTAKASVSSGAATWLNISPSGTLQTDQNLIVSVNPAGLSAGAYAGTIFLTSSRGTQTASVTLTVTAPIVVTLNPTSLAFSATVGGATPPAQSLAVSASQATNFTVSASVQSGGTNWLVVSPLGQLTSNRTLTVSVNPAGLAAGAYSGTVSVLSGGVTQKVPVTLVINPAPSTLTISPNSLTFNATLNRNAPSPQSLSVTSTSATNFTASAVTAGGGVNWLAVSPSGALTTNRTLSVSVSLGGLVAGSYSGSILIVANGASRNIPVTLVVNTVSTGGGSGFKLTGWNDLGMHCDDGQDYSVFGVLPPYNTIHAHLMDSAGKLIVNPAGYTVTYQAINDPLTNTMNTTSVLKTNFWQFAEALGFGALAADMGLKGFGMPGAGNTPQGMKFSAADNTWLAEGIPLTNYADAPAAPYPVNYFPMMRLVAKNQGGAVVATTDIVLPISDEMTCNLCHASNTGTAGARPSGGWVNHLNPAKDVKLNILRKHDDRFAASAIFQAASAARGYVAAGLEAQSAIRPFLCASCHGSNALSLAGYPGVAPLTTAMHSLHSTATLPNSGQTMESSTTRDSCYLCHPGPKTQCLRGAMATLKTSTGANAVECQGCHGPMSALAVPTRQGWLDEPACQSCHTGTATSNSGQIVYNSVFTNGTTVRVAANQTFATNANTPAAGLSLYRFSKGHGGLQCEACHGSTHAESPTPIANDNVQATTLQGHAGTLAECASCHGSVPNTVTGGPHGLHPIGSSWVNSHEHAAEGKQATCQPCHGTDYRGTILSKTQADRTMAGKSFPRGTVIGCYSCHNGPNGG
jgi:hypothetical protein